VVDKLLNIEQNFTEVLFQSKLKIIEELRHVLGVVESLQWIGFNEGDLKTNRPKIVGQFQFKDFFLIGNSIILPKIVLEWKLVE
jgi:hypothetical protein